MGPPAGLRAASRRSAPAGRAGAARSPTPRKWEVDDRAVRRGLEVSDHVGLPPRPREGGEHERGEVLHVHPRHELGAVPGHAVLARAHPHVEAAVRAVDRGRPQDRRAHRAPGGLRVEAQRGALGVLRTGVVSSTTPWTAPNTAVLERYTTARAPTHRPARRRSVTPSGGNVTTTSVCESTTHWSTSASTSSPSRRSASARAGSRVLPTTRSVATRRRATASPV